MTYVIELLEKERIFIISELKQGHKEQLTYLKELNKALGWLKILKKKQVKKANQYNMEALPVIDDHGGFANYRVMVDDESEDVSCWTEYQKPDGSNYSLIFGDFIIELKPNK